jgi:PAS domain S-box-containing protein
MGVIQWDADYRIVRWEGAAERIFGWSAAEALGQRMDVLPPVHEADAALIARAMERIGSGREASVVARYRNWTRSGQVRHCQWTNTVLTGPDGRMISVLSWVIDVAEQQLACSFDIAELKEAERRAAERATELEGLMDASTAAVLVAHDPECHYVTGNRSAYRIGRLPEGTNLSATPMEGSTRLPFRQRRGGVDVPPSELPLQEAARTGEPVTDEVELVFPDGTSLWLYGSAVPLRDAAGQVRGAVCSFVDITALKRAEAARREAEHQIRAERELLHDFVMNVPALIAITRGPEHVFEIINVLARKMLGDGDIVGQPLREAFPRLDPIVYERFDRVYRTGESISGREFSIALDWDKTGSVTPRYLNFVHQPLRGGDGQILGVMTFAVDVTAQVEARHKVEQLAAERAVLLEHAERARAEAERASRAKDDFLAMLGHELRNPLAPIQTALDLMKLRSRGQVTREQAVIERQVMHLTRLVDDLLDVSRIARGKIQLKSAPVDLRTVVTQAVEMVSPLFEERRHQLTLDVPYGVLRVQGDEARLVQVLANLLSNAAQYTEPGGRIEVHTEHRKEEEGREGEGEVVLTVKDSGVGIPPEVLPHIFNVFVQGERTPDRAKGGLGLGLAIVRSLVEMHGGKVTASSAGLGCGSEFTVRLPARSRAPAEAVAEAPRRVVRQLGGRVLIVDDNQDAAETLAEILRTVGYEVAVAYDGPGALTLASSFRPEIGILDIGLPVMDGYELAGRLKELCGPVHLLAVTGYGQEQDRLRSEQAGFAEHFVKPVDVDRLLQALRAIPPTTKPAPTAV